MKFLDFELPTFTAGNKIAPFTPRFCQYGGGTSLWDKPPISQTVFPSTATVLPSYPPIGDGTLLRHDISVTTCTWSPNPFQLLFTPSQCNLVRAYCQGDRTSTIVRVARCFNMHITAADLRDLISPTSMTYHELLLLSLEVICHSFSLGYVDTSFFPSILGGGWNEVKKRSPPPK